MIGCQEDADAMEPDLDKQEVLRPNQSELSGDRLLNTHYVNTGSSSARRRKVRCFIFNQYFSSYDLHACDMYVL